MRLTHNQMLAHWRRAHGYEDARLDCSIEHSQGIDLTMKMVTGMRGWYLNLLDTGELRHLVLTNEAARLSAAASEGEGVMQIGLPPDIRRVVGVDLDGTSLGPPNPEAVAAGLRNPFDMRPAWAVTSDRLLIITSPHPLTNVTAINCVTDPGDEFYDLDESALSLL